MTDEKDPKDEGEEKSEKAEAKAEEKAEEKKAAEKPKAEKKKKQKDPADAFRLSPDHPVSNAWKTFAGFALVGVVGSGIGYTQDHTRFAYAWLFGFICALTLAIGSMLFVMMHHLTNGSWGIVVRRVAEIFGASSWVLILLVVPVVAMRGTLFGQWLSVDAHAPKEHAQIEAPISDSMLAANDVEQVQLGGQPRGLPRGGPAGVNPHGPGGIPRGTDVGGGHPGTPIHVSMAKGAEDRALAIEHEEVMRDKTWYLSQTFFYVRFAIYFLVWYLVGTTLLKWSTDQDKSKDPAITKKLARFSAGGVMLLALTLTFAAFDWIMSLDPTWYSTIFGVIFFAGSMVCVFATLILTFLGFRNAGVLQKEVTVEHYHDLGKLLFGFMCFWAYVSFSQFMLQWYAAIPEEVTFYHHRWDQGVWKNISLALVFLHFIFPFVFIMSRNIKRNLGMLRIGAVLLLLMHVVDMYWLVMPNVPHQTSFSPSWIDVAGFLGPVCVFLAVAFRQLSQYPLVPIGDPRLERSVHFVNA